MTNPSRIEVSRYIAYRSSKSLSLPGWTLTLFPLRESDVVTRLGFHPSHELVFVALEAQTEGASELNLFERRDPSRPPQGLFDSCADGRRLRFRLGALQDGHGQLGVYLDEDRLTFASQGGLDRTGPPTPTPGSTSPGSDPVERRGLAKRAMEGRPAIGALRPGRRLLLFRFPPRSSVLLSTRIST